MNATKDNHVSSMADRGRLLKPLTAVIASAAIFAGGLLHLTSPTRALNQALSCDYEWQEIQLTRTGQQAALHADRSERSFALASALEYLAQTTSSRSADRFRAAWKVFIENSDLIGTQSLKGLVVQPVDSDAQLAVAAKSIQAVKEDALLESKRLEVEAKKQSAQAEEMLKHQADYAAQELKNPIGLSTLDDEQQNHELPFWRYLAASPSHATCAPPHILASVAKWRSS